MHDEIRGLRVSEPALGTVEFRQAISQADSLPETKTKGLQNEPAAHHRRRRFRSRGSEKSSTPQVWPSIEAGSQRHANQLPLFLKKSN
jgi:hypothetical protein